MAEQCAKNVFTSSFGGSQCLNNGKVEHAGKSWCYLHSPEGKKKLKDKMEARWAAETARRRKREDKHREQRRRAECYTDLLAAFKEAALDLHHSAHGLSPLEECSNVACGSRRERIAEAESGDV